MRSIQRLVVVAGLAVSGVAMAQAQPGADALRGPAVKEGGVPGEQRQFTPGRQRGKDMMGSEIPHRLFLRALESLRGEGAGENRLTDEQQAQLKQINEDFNASVAKYRAENQEKVRELMPQLSPEDRRRVQQFVDRRGGPNRMPGLDQRRNQPKDGSGEGMAPDAKKAEEAREKVRELLANAPNPAENHARVYGVLNEGQKKAFKAELDRLREMGREMEMRPQQKGMEDLPDGARERIKNLPPEEQERAVKRYFERLKEEAGKAEPKGGPGLDDPRIPERARERIKNLPPEERERAVKRYLERLKEEAGKPEPK
jgi:hypothetical protein